jgi:hypothetical protein
MSQPCECPVCEGKGFIKTVPESEPAPAIVPRTLGERRKGPVLVPSDAWQLAQVLLDYYGDPRPVAEVFEKLADFRSHHLARFDWMAIASRFRDAAATGTEARS